MNRACYRKLRRYKYQLMQPYIHNVEIKQYDIDTPYLKLGNDGILEIKKGYAWDGPSGPTIDTLNFMRGALVHDVLYQLIRMEKIPYSYKDYADRVLQKICREDGMICVIRDCWFFNKLLIYCPNCGLI
ncbi:MAG: hypothetical protein HZC10_07200 [Nitrospirae bacterium]|nr:hypothetical protein [Nitrospirota bacterium]